MQYLFNVWEDLSLVIKSSRRVLLLMDFDGTLTPIVEEPEAATLSPKTRLLLKSLSQKKNAEIGIVSGRALSDLRTRVALPDIIYAGNHGLEIEGPGFNFLHPIAQEIKATLLVLGTVLKKALRTFDGVSVEDKGLTLSVHYRRVQNAEKEVEVGHVFEKTVGVARMLGRIKTTVGKKVYEVRPMVSWDKGKAILMLIKTYSRGPVLPIYIGDDLTDEDAFRAISDGPGVSIYVGKEYGSSAAKYYLDSPSDVEEFLIRLNNVL